MLADHVACPLQLQPGVEAHHIMHRQKLSSLSTDETSTCAAQAIHTFRYAKVQHAQLMVPAMHAATVHLTFVMFRLMFAMSGSSIT